MRYGYVLLVVVLVGVFSYGAYNTTKVAKNVISQRTETINAILNGDK